MKIQGLIFVRLTAAVFACSLVILSNCRDKPFEPGGTPKDYPAYFWSAISNDSNWYFAYHPSTNTVDSMFLPYSAPPFVSADGKKLFMINYSSAAVDVLETDSFTVIDQLPYTSVIAASPDNELLLAYRNGEGYHFIKSSDYSSIYVDTTIRTGSFPGKFSRDGKKFYGIIGSATIRVFELSDSIYVSSQYDAPFGIVKDLEFSRDGKKIFYYLRSGTLEHQFVVYDISTDSIIFTESIHPGFGELAVMANDRYVFYSNPGTMLGPTFGDPWVTVYDVESNTILSTITTAGLLDPPNQSGVPLGPLCITPDEKQLIVLSERSFDFICAINIRRLKIEKYIHFPQGYILEGLTCPSCH